MLAVVGLALRGLAIANTSQTAVSNMPLPDDAFYYFMLARNLAAGGGTSISGNGISTTGFQPLWAGWLALVETVGGGFDPALRIAVAQWTGALLGVAAAALIFVAARRLIRDDRPALLAAGAFLLSPQIVKHNLNGMETSLAMLGFGLVLALGLDFSPERTRRGQALLLGVVCGLAILARIDLVILVGLLAARWIWMTRRAGRGWDRVGLVGAGLGMVLAPWALIALRAGSGLVPESGQAVRQLTLLLHDLPLTDLAQSVRDAPAVFIPVYLRYAIEFTAAWARQVPSLLPLTLPIFAFLSANAAENATTALVIVVVGLLVLAAVRSHNRPLQTVLGFGMAFGLLLTAAYSTAVLGPWFFQRYAAPLGVLFHVLLLAGIAALVPNLKRAGVVYGLAAIGIAIGFALLIAEGSYRWILAGEAAVPDDGFHRAAEWIDLGVPPEARVGVFSAGLISYAVRQPVVALDGKVNRLAREAMRDGRMFDYLCAEGIEVVADWEKMVDRLLIRRSEGWQEENLRLVETIDVENGNDILIYQVNRGACSDG